MKNFPTRLQSHFLSIIIIKASSFSFLWKHMISNMFSSMLLAVCRFLLFVFEGNEMEIFFVLCISEQPFYLSKLLLLLCSKGRTDLNILILKFKYLIFNILCSFCFVFKKTKHNALEWSLMGRSSKCRFFILHQYFDKWQYVHNLSVSASQTTMTNVNV